VRVRFPGGDAVNGTMEIASLVVTLTRLAAGILSTQDPSMPVTSKQALAFAQAAVAAAESRGVDPFELVGIARTESAYRENNVGPDGLDCGITQTRVTGSKYSCYRLNHDYKIGFAEGAREMAQYQASCKGRSDYDRCRFNRYNSGYRYATHGWAGRYWLRVMCYTEAARRGQDGAGCVNVARPGELQVAAATRHPTRISWSSRELASSRMQAPLYR
jgi:hypothetical protein